MHPLYAIQARILPSIMFKNRDAFFKAPADAMRRMIVNMCQDITDPPDPEAHTWIEDVSCEPRFARAAVLITYRSPHAMQSFAPLSFYTLALAGAQSPRYFAWEHFLDDAAQAVLGEWTQQAHLNYGAHANLGADSFLTAVGAKL